MFFFILFYLFTSIIIFIISIFSFFFAKINGHYLTKNTLLDHKKQYNDKESDQFLIS